MTSKIVDNIASNMVSRLLSSISGMLSPPERDSTKNGNHNPNDDDEREQVTPDTTDTYIKSDIPIPIERKASSRMSNFDLQFINAETMDRAIVNRLQSRMSTSVADVLVEAQPSMTGVKLRCERSDSKVQDSRAPQQQQSRAQLQDSKAPHQQQSRAQLHDHKALKQQQSRAQLQDPRVPQQQQSRTQLQDNKALQQHQSRAPSQDHKALQQQQSRAPSQDHKALQQQQSRAQLQDPRIPQQHQSKVKQQDNRVPQQQQTRGPQQQQSGVQPQDPRAPQQQQSKVKLQDSRAAQQQQSKAQLQDHKASQQQQSKVQLQDSDVPQQEQSKVKMQEPRAPPPSRVFQESRPPQPPRVQHESHERALVRRIVEESGEESEEREQEDSTSDAFSEQDKPLVSENTRSRHRSVPVKESLSQSSVLSHDIPANMQNKIVHHSHPTRASSADERRGVMYRNSQFNLENSSKEALCSDSSKALPQLEEEEESHPSSNALLHLPLFGIPDPSRHRISSAASSSMESLPSQERYREVPFKNQQTRRAVSPTAGRSYYLSRRLSVSQIDDHLFESSINDIIERGGDEFKTKYSSWIWDAFRTQLVKLKSLMVQEFNEKLKLALEEREYEFSDLQKRYQDKLVEFDTSTENFQRLMDSMNKDNQRMLSAKDFVIDKLKKEFLECKKHFEQDLQRQVQSFRKEAEVERMELQKRNDELMLIMLSDQSSSGLEDAFKNEIDSLHAMIKTLNARNELLNQQLEEATNASTAMNRRTVENLEAHLNQASSQLMEIQKKYIDTLEYADNEKEDLIVAHNQEIAKLNRKLQESSTKYEHQLRDAMEELAAARKKHSREIKDYKQKMATQESQQKQLMAQVRQEYGSEVDTLSQAVCQLRAELTLRGASARLSQAAKESNSNIR